MSNYEWNNKMLYMITPLRVVMGLLMLCGTQRRIFNSPVLHIAKILYWNIDHGQMYSIISKDK